MYNYFVFQTQSVNFPISFFVTPLFSLQMDTSGSDRILVMGTTNKPEDIDEAALRYQYSMILNVAFHKVDVW